MRIIDSLVEERDCESLFGLLSSLVLDECDRRDLGSFSPERRAPARMNIRRKAR